jgi:predicted DNA-binding protein (MmcQ/YjbR family)
MKKRPTKLAQLDATLSKRALQYPGAYEDFPWGDRVFKVAKKIFLFAQVRDGEFRMSVKLPVSADAVLHIPFAEPTGYGLGKAGWVSLRFEASAAPPAEMLLAWLDESYRAIAPKKNVRAIEAPSAPEPTRKPSKRALPKRKSR